MECFELTLEILRLLEGSVQAGQRLGWALRGTRLYGSVGLLVDGLYCSLSRLEILLQKFVRQAQQRLFEEEMRIGIQLEDAVPGHGGSGECGCCRDSVLRECCRRLAILGAAATSRMVYRLRHVLAIVAELHDASY
jgi:hypothetical protein